MILNDLEPLNEGFLVNFSQFLASVHISRVNCNETHGDRLIQPAYETFSSKCKFWQSNDRPFRFE